MVVYCGLFEVNQLLPIISVLDFVLLLYYVSWFGVDYNGGRKVETRELTSKE